MIDFIHNPTASIDITNLKDARTLKLAFFEKMYCVP